MRAARSRTGSRRRVLGCGAARARHRVLGPEAFDIIVFSAQGHRVLVDVLRDVTVARRGPQNHRARSLDALEREVLACSLELHPESVRVAHDRQEHGEGAVLVLGLDCLRLPARRDVGQQPQNFLELAVVHVRRGSSTAYSLNITTNSTQLAVNLSVRSGRARGLSKFENGKRSLKLAVQAWNIYKIEAISDPAQHEASCVPARTSPLHLAPSSPAISSFHHYLPRPHHMLRATAVTFTRSPHLPR